MSPEHSSAARRLRPWRSARLGWAVTAVVLAGGVPLFLCSPPWNDVTLHDLATRNILRGGVHYRDLFDTNLPGIDWAMAAVRAVFGWRYETLRAADLLVVGGATAVVGWLARRAGGGAAAAAWYAAAVALFYPFTSEFNHVQRDGWMLLPAAAAAALRVWRLGRAGPARAERHPSVAWAVGEGFLWGLAVWVKPHALVMAAGVWAVSAAGLSRRAAAADLGGLVAGGLGAGVPGVAWLIGSGAWPYFWDVFIRWNPEYLSVDTDTRWEKLKYAFTCFRPWGLVHFLALPLAAVDVLRAVGLVSRGDARPARQVDARGVLAALYLGWFAQAVFVQKGFEYVHLPVTLLGLGVVAGRGWATGFAALVWFAAVGLLLLVPGSDRLADRVKASTRWVRLDRHRLTDPRVLGVWPRCWAEGGSARVRDRLNRYPGTHCVTGWEELEAVAAFLRTVDPPVGDRELTCWHDSTHPLYLMLGVEPSTRYMHFGTVFPIRSRADEIRRAVADSRQRYVVSDLARMTWEPALADAPGAAGPHSLPGWLPVSQRRLFPWDQPVVFRDGRYVVHKVDHRPDPARIDVPDWADLGDLGPGD